MRRRIAAAALLAVVAACSSSDLDTAGPTTDRTTSSSTPTTVPSEPDDGPGDIEPIAWEVCGADECATVTVPVDHDDPDGATIDLFVQRIPAAGDRIGALWLNFGGPGGSVADTIGLWPVPAAIREHFDIVGMDPRGVGRSSPLDCGLPAAELYAPDPTIDEAADVDALLSVSEAYVADCEADKGALLPHLGTRDVARDMDLIRARMGDDAIDYLGYSYGTSIGQAYAAEFGDRVRTMILDGVVDPAPDGIEVATTQAVGFETALAAWAADCPARSCGIDDPVAAVERVLALAEGGIPAADGRTLGPGEAAVGLAYPLYSQLSWPRLDQAVADALSNDSSGMLSLADDYVGLADFSIYFAVSCLDATWPTDTDEFLAEAKAAESVAPRFGEAIVIDYIRCALWPTPPDPLGAITADDAPPIVVVSTTGDPATPYENGVRVAERLASGVLVTNRGEGHTVVFQGSDCIDSLMIDYIVERAVPPDGTSC